MGQFTCIDDALLCLAISDAKTISLVCPGVSMAVADALVKAMQGGSTVNVVLDADPEIFRMGYGELDGLVALEDAMLLHGASIMKYEGLRIGLLITEKIAVCYSPVPLLVEGGSNRERKPNGICLSEAAATEIEESVAAEISGNRLNSEDVAAAKRDIEERPVMNFDISRTERVYQSFIRYAEFEVNNYLLQTKRINIPPELMPIDQPYLRERVASVLRPYEDPKIFEVEMTSNALFADRLPFNTDVLSPTRIDQLRREMRSRYLVELPSFGTFITTATIAEFEAAIECFQTLVNDYGMLLQQRLEEVHSRIRWELFQAIRPHVTAFPPLGWAKYRTGQALSANQIEERLGYEIDRLLRNLPTQYAPKISVVYKDVTFATIRQEGFRAALTKAFGATAAEKYFPEHTATPAKDC